MSSSETPDVPIDRTDDVRPLVGVDSGNRPLWFAIAAILVAGLLLFSLLDARRREATAPAVRPRAADLALSNTAIPPLYVPPEPQAVIREDAALTLPAPQTPAPPTQPWPSLPLTPASPSSGQTEPFAPQVPTIPTQTASAPSGGPAIVFDATVADAASAAGPGSPGSGEAPGAAKAVRARATRLLNSPTVVPQGTLIAAVLETALDSTQPGQARALVSRDVANLRGDRILIPRGSRLFGTYRGELSAGQKRAQVEWPRLVRPDGVTIAIDSPAADRLGRAGIGGQVNTHFLERFGGALLQSTIDFGSALATRSIGDGGFVVALPRGGATSQLVDQAPKPTLRVRQGARISVFVARDLDFTAVEQRR
ncbi:MAG: TrbI/VirB10 family protein [Sphingomonadales bacterium]|nr:TrbI/VirB10 family protein [Sphingomonadales bacterium]